MEPDNVSATSLASAAVLEAILPSFTQYEKAVEDTKTAQVALTARLQALLSEITAAQHLTNAGDEGHRPSRPIVVARRVELLQRRVVDVAGVLDTVQRRLDGIQSVLEKSDKGKRVRAVTSTSAAISADRPRTGTDGEGAAPASQIAAVALASASAETLS